MDENCRKLELASAMLSLLRITLHQAIDLWTGSKAEIGAKQVANVWIEQSTVGSAAQAIPIRRMGDAIPVVYASAIAHRLATQPCHVAPIAAQLVATLQQDLLSHREPLLQEVTVHATATGFVHFEVGDRAIAAWLDLLVVNALPEQPLSTSISFISESERQLMVQSSAVFEVQHAHARCCSLLRLAHREALISLKNLEEAPFYWRFSSPTSLPWFTADKLCLNDPDDRSLLSQLIAAYDHLSDSSQQQTQTTLLRSAQAVAQAFQSFHREHPMWGKTGEEPTLTTIRLGLLMATQRVLYMFLWDGLGLYPATEL